MKLAANRYHGVSRTIKASYYKVSLSNFLRTDSRGAGGVMMIERDEEISVVHTGQQGKGNWKECEKSVQHHPLLNRGGGSMSSHIIEINEACSEEGKD